VTLPRYCWGLFLSAALGYRLTFFSMFYLEALLGAGYLHTFVDGAVYREDGQVAAYHGSPAVMPRIALGSGLRLGNLEPFLRIETFGQYPYNNALLPHAALAAGCSFSLGD
jgi:hypothetical protein